MDLKVQYNAETPIIWRGEYHFPMSKIDNLRDEVVGMEDCRRIKVPKDHETGEIYSTYFINDVFKRPEVTLLPVYKDIISQVSIDMNFVDSDFSINYWFQVYDGSHESHMHFTAMSPYSFVHFIRPTEEKCFYFSGSDGSKLYPKQDPGDIIVFPSMILHGVDASYGKTRVSIAGNIMFSTVRTPCTNTGVKITEIRAGLDVTEIYSG
jgi:hypothetical protein